MDSAPEFKVGEPLIDIEGNLYTFLAESFETTCVIVLRVTDQPGKPAFFERCNGERFDRVVTKQLRRPKEDERALVDFVLSFG